MAGNALIVDGIGKYFPVPQVGWRAWLNPFAPLTHLALRDISFQVGAAEIVALIGVNGSGKSTLLRILATLLLPSAGRASVSGYDVEQEPSQVRTQLGFHSATDGGFYSRLTARENLKFFAAMNSLFDAESSERVEELTRLMGLEPFADSQVRTLSTGQVHRLGLARAMLHRPRVLLLDEPTRSLDPMAAAEFRKFLKIELVERRGTTVLFASHTLAEVEELADRVVLLDHGRLIAYDSPGRLRTAVGGGTFQEALSRLIGSGLSAEVLS